jgi:spermidine/putrescine transport system permease protein
MASPTRTDRLARWATVLPPTAFLLAFVAAPALIVVLASLREPGEFGGLAPWQGVSFDAYRFLFSDFIYAEIFLRSLLVAAATTLICLVLAYPLAWLIARSPKKQRDLLVLLVMLPFASNFLIRIYAWIMMLGPLNLLFTSTAVMIGMVYVHLPFMVLPLYVNLERHDPALLEAARDLGAGAWTRFWRITFPLSLPGVFAGGALVFIPVFGMFAVPELLGGTGDILIANLIKEEFLADRDWPLGSALSVLLTGAVLACAGLATVAARRGFKGTQT